MKTTINGFKLNKNGKVIIQSKGEVYIGAYLGFNFKEKGTYYYFNRKQGSKFVYTE